MAGSKVHGRARPGEDEQQQHEHAQEAEGFLFAPRDVAPWQIEGKDDLHGIGYSGMQEQAVLGSQGATKALYGMSGQVSSTVMPLFLFLCCHTNLAVCVWQLYSPIQTGL